MYNEDQAFLLSCMGSCYSATCVSLWSVVSFVHRWVCVADSRCRHACVIESMENLDCSIWITNGFLSLGTSHIWSSSFSLVAFNLSYISYINGHVEFKNVWPGYPVPWNGLWSLWSCAVLLLSFMSCLFGWFHLCRNVLVTLGCMIE